MAYIDDQSLDAALLDIRTNTTKLHLCSSLPANYAAVDGLSLATKDNPSIGAPVDGTVNGRRCIVAAISDGVVNATGTATYYVLVDDVNARIKVLNPLAAPLIFTTTDPFSLPAFNITIFDAQ